MQGVMYPYIEMIAHKNTSLYVFQGNLLAVTDAARGKIFLKSGRNIVELLFMPLGIQV